MTKLHVAVSMVPALFSLPALADQIWWTESHEMAFDYTGEVYLSNYTCAQTRKGTLGESPAKWYELEKITSPGIKIIDKGDEVDVAGAVFYRTEKACLKVIEPLNAAAAAKAAASAAAKAKEDKLLEKYR